MKLGEIKEVFSNYIYDLTARYGVYIIALLLFLGGRFFGVIGKRRQMLKYIMFAHRLYPNNYFSKTISTNLNVLKSHLNELVDDASDVTGAATRSIVLKMPAYNNGKQVSKGILLITFTRTFTYYYHHIDIPKLFKEYHVVLEPSWAGYCDPDILFWSYFNEPVIVEATEIKDRQFLNHIDTNLKPVSFGASDWVDHRIFYPTGDEKIYDVVYVCNLTPIKRIHAYFRAIKQAANIDKDFRAALVTLKWGSNSAKLENLINYYGIKQSLSCFQELPPSEVNKIFNQSRVSILLSLKEGSNRVLFESIFADTPVILLNENTGVNKDYINDQTGRLVAESDLAKSMLYFKNNPKITSPRSWAMENIAPDVTTKKLVDVINSLNPEQKIDYLDVAVKVNSPEVNYFNNSDRKKMMPCNELLTKYKRSD